MDKPILTHTIAANSFDEMDKLLRNWLKKMRGKIETLEMKDGGLVKPGQRSLTITYYYLDTRQVEFTLEELEYIAEHFHDALKDQPDNKVLQSIEEKTEKALGWK